MDNKNFATAHSCGLRLIKVQCWNLIRSLPQRIRAGCDTRAKFLRAKTYTLPQRIRAGCDSVGLNAVLFFSSLPQRIRAGCDARFALFPQGSSLCHSAFVRVATKSEVNDLRKTILCHSAFVRVATQHIAQCYLSSDFATAHSCGLRPCTIDSDNNITYLCHSAFVRVATFA